MIDQRPSRGRMVRQVFARLERRGGGGLPAELRIETYATDGDEPCVAIVYEVDGQFKARTMIHRRNLDLLVSAINRARNPVGHRCVTPIGEFQIAQSRFQGRTTRIGVAEDPPRRPAILIGCFEGGRRLGGSTLVGPEIDALAHACEFVMSI